jgi:hypothetical protein
MRLPPRNMEEQFAFQDPKLKRDLSLTELQLAGKS